MVRIVLFAFLLLQNFFVNAQPLSQKKKFTRADSLRGTLNERRSWWDVLHYDINVTPDYATKTIKGKTTIQY